MSLVDGDARGPQRTGGKTFTVAGIQNVLTFMHERHGLIVSGTLTMIDDEGARVWKVVDSRVVE